MNKYKDAILSCILFLLLALSSCFQDRSGEYEALIQEDKWITGQMRNIYLWYYDMPADNKLDFFATPQNFFPTLLATKANNGKADKYSYIEMDEETATRSIDQNSSYGFDFILYKDPSGKSSRLYARVIFVLPHSPASESGLRRGDWIAGVNQENLTKENYGYLYHGEERRFATADLILNTNEKYEWVNSDTLTLAASRKIEDNPFYVDSIYHLNGKRIAYLMYNRFSTGPANTPDEQTYNDQMRHIFSDFKSAGFDDFILDLRYNPGGYLSCSQVLASLLAPSDALGKTYCSLLYNDKNMDKNSTFLLDAALTDGANLNLKKLYVIVSNLTASAAEAVIYCLKPYIGAENIILIGTRTEGKNVASIEIPSPYNFTLHPIVAYLLDAEGESNYYDGLQPKYELDETQFITPLYNLGDIQERMLYNTLSLIINGTMPDFKPNEPEIPAEKLILNSISGKKANHLIIK